MRQYLLGFSSIKRINPGNRIDNRLLIINLAAIAEGLDSNAKPLLNQIK